MDDSRFDALSRAMGAMGHRRRALRVLAGAGLLGLAGRSEPAAAACSRKDARCGGRQGRCCTGLECCRGRCRDLQTDDRACGRCGTACDTGDGQTCRHGACICADDRPVCDTFCCSAPCSCDGTGKRCLCPLG